MSPKCAVFFYGAVVFSSHFLNSSRNGGVRAKSMGQFLDYLLPATGIKYFLSSFEFVANCLAFCFSFYYGSLLTVNNTCILFEKLKVPNLAFEFLCALPDLQCIAMISGEIDLNLEHWYKCFRSKRD
jgi:hypothetical protein